MASTLCVVDTTARIEWLAVSAVWKKLGKRLPDRAQCIVPTIVQLELSKWLVRKLDEDQADQVIAYTQKCEIAPLDTRIALLAAALHRDYKLATADAIVYATAREWNAELLTCDAHSRGLASVIYFAKKGGHTSAPSDRT